MQDNQTEQQPIHITLTQPPESAQGKAISYMQGVYTLICIVLAVGSGFINYNARLQRVEMLADQRTAIIKDINDKNSDQDKVIASMSVHLASIDAKLGSLIDAIRDTQTNSPRK